MAIALSPSNSVEEGESITATMSFSGLEADSDTSTTDYIFRADVLDSEGEDADGCEGAGMGVDRSFNKVDEDPEVRTASTDADCPAGAYTLRASVSSPDNTELASASVGFGVLEEPTIVVVPPPDEPDPAEQNDAVTLVSNIGKNTTGSRAVDLSNRAQPFGTGTNANGYNLENITVHFKAAATGTGTLTVTVREAVSNSPSATVLYTLTNPATISAGVNEFAAPSAATLDADSTYFLVAEYSADSGGPKCTVGGTIFEMWLGAL